LNKNREPNLSYVLDTGRSIAPYLKSGEVDLEMEDGRSKIEGTGSRAPHPHPLPDRGGEGEAMASPISELPTANSQPLRKLIVLESTTYPGTTEEELRAVLEENSPFVEPDGQPTTDDRQRTTENTIQTSEVSGQLSVVSGQRRGARRMRAGVDFHLAFSPERVDPGRRDWTTSNTPKILGGLTRACTERAAELYGSAVETIVPVSSPETAEMSKLLENIFRAVNIALVNELAQLCERMDLDVWEVVEAAETKPFGFMSFKPGPGLGGHCIPIDPFYLTWKAREYDFATEFIDLAGKVNANMPYFCRSLISQALNHGAQKSLKGSRILVLGVAYKADIDDVRESPAEKIIELLRKAGADVAYHDPHVREFDGLRSTEYEPERYDCVVIVTAHGSIDYEDLVQRAQIVVDLRNATGRNGTGNGKVWKL